MKPFLSIIIPTRTRSRYLQHCLKTCFATTESDTEIVVLDNCSEDDTQEVIKSFHDPRLHIIRHDQRLSMRDNFEAGVAMSTGAVLCILGDDDGILSDTPAQLKRLFSDSSIAAVTAERCHYSWPCINLARKNCVLIPRSHGIHRRNSRLELRDLLQTRDYYQLPCLYHGFVRRELVQKVNRRCGRVFVSSQPDIVSAIALSAENVDYLHSDRPLLINGGSARSNGAAHFQGGSRAERDLWKAEDNLGFLAGLDTSLGIEALILESALRYDHCARSGGLSELFSPKQIVSTGCWLATRAASRTKSDHARDSILTALGIHPKAYRPTSGVWGGARRLRQAKAFLQSMPLDASAFGAKNVFDVSQLIGRLLASRSVGYTSLLWNQLSAALRFAA